MKVHNDILEQDASMLLCWMFNIEKQNANIL